MIKILVLNRGFGVGHFNYESLLCVRSTPVAMVIGNENLQISHKIY